MTSTQQHIAGLGHSNTPKLFRYVLSTKDDTPLELRHVPDGWSDSELTFKRDKKYKGVLETFSTSELIFIKEGRDFIRDAYERGGIDYNITITISIKNNSTFKYETYFAGKLDLSTYRIDDIGVMCDVINTGFQATVLNRDDIKVDMMSNKFIGGGEDSMAALSGVWQSVTIPSYTASQNADWNVKGEKFNPPDPYVHFVPMAEIASEFDGTGDQEIDSSDAFLTATESHTFDLTGTVLAEMTTTGTPSKFTIQVTLKKNGITVNTWYQTTPSTVENIVFTIIISELAMSVVSGDVLTLESEVVANPHVNYIFTYNGTNISMESTVGSTLASINPAMFYAFESFARTIQLISGDVNPFESTELGRTDSVPVSYGSDGDNSLIATTNGKWIREFSPNVHGLNFSLSELFESFNTVVNIGLGFEYVTDREKVVVEKESYFFDISDNSDYPATDTRPYLVNQILDLSADVTDNIISKEVLPDWYYNEIEVGFNNFEYENIQGLKEFNTKSSYATPIKSVKNKLSLISDIRMDTQGVNKLREKPFSTYPTEDVNGDADNFMFDVKRAGVSPIVFTVKTDEDFTDVYGGVDPTQSYNLNRTPRRNLERHGNRIKSMRLAAGDEIQWLKSEKNTSLVTQKTGEATSKAENGDIVVDNLTDGYWIAEAYMFEAPINKDTITAIQANPYGVMKIGTDKYGWILEVQTNNEEGKGEFRLLRVDLDNVKVIV